MSTVSRVAEQIEQSYGSVMTYTAAAANAGIGAWLGENWFLVLSALAVVVRVVIDVDTWRRKRKETQIPKT